MIELSWQQAFAFVGMLFGVGYILRSFGSGSKVSIDVDALSELSEKERKKLFDSL